MSAPMIDRIRKLADWCETRDFAGSDPYDALNSRLLRFLSFGSKPGRMFWTQLLRRSRFDLRKLLLVPPGCNPKGAGLFLEGYSALARIFPDDPRWRRGAEHLLDKLEALKASGWHGNSWGYHFPWQSRAAFVPRGTPTVVNTAFIGHALLNAGDSLGSERAMKLAEGCADFIVNDLNRLEEGDATCFSYTPVDNNYVHNANLLGASLLARLGSLYRRDDWIQTARRALAYSMNHQHDDGSWYYAEADIQHWIDSFHTGFNLEALRWFLKLGLADEYRSAYERGVVYYAENFFGPDYLPKYYHDRVYCVDIHSPTEAICFFSGCGDRYRELTDGVFKWLFDHMYDERNGIFHYRWSNGRSVEIPYMRWAEAWAFRALTTYYANRECGNATGMAVGERRCFPFFQER